MAALREISQRYAKFDEHTVSVQYKTIGFIPVFH